MFSPYALALLQDALDAVEPPVTTRNGTLTATEVRELRLATEREVSNIAPAGPPLRDEDQLGSPIGPNEDTSIDEGVGADASQDTQQQRSEAL